MVTHDPLARRIAAIAADRRSGASSLCRRAVSVLLDAHEAGGTAVRRTALALCVAQPAMAPVWQAAALALGDDAPAALASLTRRVTRAPTAIAGVLADLLSPEAADHLTVVTVSSSAVVRACLDRLASRTHLAVVCGEGRPRL